MGCNARSDRELADILAGCRTLPEWHAEFAVYSKRQNRSLTYVNGWLRKWLTRYRSEPQQS